MTKLRATSIALVLAVAALALGACGGDDEGSKESATTGTDATATGTGTTDTTTGATDTGTTERTGKTNTRERKRDDKGGSRRGSDDSSGSGGKGNSGSAPETQLTAKNVYSTAKTVCNQFLPNVVARDLENGKTSAEEVAKDYAGVYPSDERKRAYDGCLAGLKARE